MGCFNMACGISGYHIASGDDCYMAILFPNSYEDINMGPLVKYRFLSLPILGKYNDYGDIEEVVRDNSIKILEKFFGIPIAGITECASDFRKRNGIEYSAFGSLQKWYGVEKINSYIDKKTLEDFGCIFSNDTFTFTHPEVKLPEGHNFSLKEVVGGYGTKVIYSFDGKKQELDNYERLFEVLNSIKFSDWRGYKWQKRPEYIFGVSREMQSKAMILHKAEVVFFKKEIFDGFLKIHMEENEKDESYQKYYKKYDVENREKFIEVLGAKNIERRQIVGLFSDRLSYLRNFYNFYDIYGEESIKFIDELEKIHFFTAMLYKLNRVIQPTLSLEQHGSKREQIPFIKFHLDLLKKEVKEEKNY